MSTRVVSLLNMKGGVGKTTLAVNLAWQTYKARNRVLLIDFDPQFNATQYMMGYDEFAAHTKDKGTIADWLLDQPALHLRTKRKDVSPRKMICRREMSHGGKYFLDLLPSQLELAHVVKNPAQMEFKLQKKLELIRDDYDYIFIDCAPTDSVLTTMALTASNYILIPVRPDRFSILGYANLMQTIKQFKKDCGDPNDVDVMGVIFTQVRVKGGRGVESECMKEIRDIAKEKGDYVFDSELVFSDTIIRAVQNQTPIVQTKYARGDLKDCVRGIVEEMTDRIDECEEG